MCRVEDHLAAIVLRPRRHNLRECAELKMWRNPHEKNHVKTQFTRVCRIEGRAQHEHSKRNAGHNSRECTELKSSNFQRIKKEDKLEKVREFLLLLKEILESEVATLIMFMGLFASIFVYYMQYIGILDANNEIITICCLVVFAISVSYFLFRILKFIVISINKIYARLHSIYYLKHLITVDESKLLYENYYDENTGAFKRNSNIDKHNAQVTSLIKNKLLKYVGDGSGFISCNLNDNILSYLNIRVLNGEIVLVKKKAEFTHSYPNEPKVVCMLIDGCRYTNQPHINSYNPKDYLIKRIEVQVHDSHRP